MCRLWEYGIVFSGMTLYAVAAFLPEYFPFAIPVLGPITEYFVVNHRVCLIVGFAIRICRL